MTQVYIERYWRDAKPEDAIKEPPMVARFRDSIDCNSAISIWSEPMHLVGWDRTDNMNWCNGQCWWKFCQVYDAPDPGEGWRLIDPDKDNYNQDGIEFWNKDKNTWVDRWACKGRAFLTDTFYRIRITPAVTYVPFTWEDREQLRGRWYRVTLSTGEIRECQIEFFRLNRGVFFVGWFASEQLLEKGAIFLDTGKLVGKEVVQ